MNVNVQISIDDKARSHLADLIDGKTSKRLVTRAEVNALCRMFLEHLLTENLGNKIDTHVPSVADDADADILAGKHPNYVRGWNQVKHRMSSMEASR